MATEQFRIEVYEPGSGDDLLATWALSAPLAVHVGEVLHLSTAGVEEQPLDGLRVVRVEHLLYGAQSAPMKHKLMVFTELAAP